MYIIEIQCKKRRDLQCVDNCRFSDTLLSNTLVLLYYCIEMSKPSNAKEMTCTLNEEIQFETNNIIDNMSKVNKGMNMLQIVIELLQRNELKEQHGLLQVSEAIN